MCEHFGAELTAIAHAIALRKSVFSVVLSFNSEAMLALPELQLIAFQIDF